MESFFFSPKLIRYSANSFTSEFLFYWTKASDEQDAKKGLLKAELENILGKPKDKVVSDEFHFFFHPFEKYADFLLQFRL